MQFSKGRRTEKKAEVASLFYSKWKRAESNVLYALMKKEWRASVG
jgi:hypothetical protein